MKTPVDDLIEEAVMVATSVPCDHPGARPVCASCAEMVARHLARRAHGTKLQLDNERAAHEVTSRRAARDAEHAAASSVAWEALERIARVNDLLGNAVGHGHDEETCGMCRAIDIARAALALRPGGKP